MIVTNKSSNLNKSIVFEARLNEFNYKGYAQKKYYNGQSPDSFVLSKLEGREPLWVLEFGAGQGRNTIPIARMGHNVMPCETNKLGVEQICEKACQEGLYSKTLILKHNILEPLILMKKADFAFMSHVSQHLNIKELQTVFNNISANLEPGGEFVFDALIRMKEKYKKYNNLSLIFQLADNYNYINSIEKFGAASFVRQDIISAAQNSGLKVIQEVPFAEKGKRVWYEKSNLWGGFRIRDFLLGIGKKPVKLTWFVLKK